MLYKLQRKSHYVLVHEKTNSIFVSTEYRFHNYLKLVLKLISNFSTLSFTRETRRRSTTFNRLINRETSRWNARKFLCEWKSYRCAFNSARQSSRQRRRTMRRNQTTKIRADKSVSLVFKLHRRTLEIHDETITGRR